MIQLPTSLLAQVDADYLGRIGQARVAERHEVVRQCGFPDAPPAEADAAARIRLMRRDRKAVRGFTFVPDGPEGAARVCDVPPDMVASVPDRMPRTPVADPGVGR